MTIHRLIENRYNAAIGSPVVIGGVNNSYKNEWQTGVNYIIDGEDYYAGSVQVATVVKLSLQLPQDEALIGFAESNPRRYNLGEYSRGTITHTKERGKIESLEQAIVWLSPRYVLDRCESGRLKMLTTRTRPRANISASVQRRYSISGDFKLAPTVYDGTVIIPPPGISGSEFGTITSNGATAADVLIPKRQFELDMTDARLEFSEILQQGYRPSYNLTNTQSDFEDVYFRIYLEPGVTGNLSMSFYKVGEFSDQPFDLPPVYASGSFPGL